MDVWEKLVELLKEISYDQKLGWYDLWDMRDGAEDIADLLIAHGATVQEWISVKDERKPKNDDVTICYMHSDQYLILRWDDNLKLWFDEDTSYGLKDVAYWQIPQPPKGE